MPNLMRFRLPVAQVITVSLVALALPPAPARSAVLDDLFERPGPNLYRQCATDLLRAKVPNAVAAAACSNTVRPDDLGVCVRRMAEVQVAGEQAVEVCRRVRRPLEAGTCVVHISRNAAQTLFADVLEGCRRTLLPLSFSQCVVGLNRDLNLATKQAIDTCLDTSDRPRDVLPVSIPGSNLPPRIPTITPSTSPTTPDTPLPPSASPTQLRTTPNTTPDTTPNLSLPQRN
ncbi:MAG: hypothetical protein KME13_23095 [Myxacorys californica WJT36-NPBG1]|nr:hypothetical protein [Myxacorys californica WJT36-NPBG1]